MSNVLKSLGSKMLVLSEKDVRRCLSMADCLKINREALMSIASPNAASQVGGTGNVPSRLGLAGPPPTTTTPIEGEAAAAAATDTAEDWTLFKPAAFYANETGGKESLMGMKIVSIRAQNPQQGLPLVPATITVLDATSGIVQAIVSATYLTGARTAASSGLATQLTRPDLEHLVVFGAGLQAECHIDAIQTAIQRPIPKITIVNRTYERAQKLQEKIAASSSESVSVTTCNVVLLGDTSAVEEALSTADVVAATTNATKPLFDGSVLPPRCHINGIGSYTPEMQEIPANAVNRSRILIDTPGAKTVGDLKHLEQASHHQHQHPMTILGDALANPSLFLTESKDPQYDISFFKGVGTAIQDVMTADLVVKRARELGIGTEVEMS